MPSNAAIRTLLESVRDPEIPALSIVDLGVLRDVYKHDDEVVVVITPTYSGCPAMQTIAADIEQCLAEAGIARVRIETRLAPAWTTDWMSDEGRKKLLAFGIAPPLDSAKSSRCGNGSGTAISCPQCGSTQTELLSPFGSTACKALYRCENCAEPFEYFKCI